MKKKTINLDPRLSLAASFVKGRSVADIGTDHAYIPIYLLTEGKCTTAIASDINEGPLMRARANASEYSVDSNIHFALTDGLERLLSPLKVIRLPVHEFSMMMTIALRFIPTLIEETDKIMNAQKARGADFNSGGLIKRAKALLPVLIPLFASSFRRAGELATAMECRCYRGDKGRTRMTKLHFGLVDLVVLLLFAAFLTENEVL